MPTQVANVNAAYARPRIELDSRYAALCRVTVDGKDLPTVHVSVDVEMDSQPTVTLVIPMDLVDLVLPYEVPKP